MDTRPIPRMMSVHQADETWVLPEYAFRRLVEEATIPVVCSGKRSYIYTLWCFVG